MSQRVCLCLSRLKSTPAATTVFVSRLISLSEASVQLGSTLTRQVGVEL